MPALGHIYVTAHGSYTATPWVGEFAQIGFRLPTVAVANAPALGEVYTPVSNGDVVADSGSTAGTNGTLARTWEARLGLIGSTDNADAGTQADLADDVWTFLNSIKAYVTTGFRWTHVKIAPILTDGTYGAPSAIYTFTSPLIGTSPGNMFPPEVALACSMRANIIGRRGRGRVYIPGLTVSNLDANLGTVASGTRTSLANSLKTCIQNLGNMPGVTDFAPSVAVMSAGSTTAVRPAEVRVGDHFDVQRRRQHQVPETYTIVAL